jgi:hypothetical protein
MAAEFTINGTAFDTLEYEAEHDEVLSLTLEDAPGLDAPTVTYSVVIASDGAPALTFSPSTGIPTTPTGTVTVTMPSSGTHSWRIQCQINNGYDSSGRWNSTYTKERIVSIRSPNLGIRKLVPGETTQAHVSGWTVAQNEMVDAIDNGLGSVASSWTQVLGASGLSSGADRYWAPGFGASSAVVRWRVPVACVATSMHFTCTAGQASSSGSSTMTLSRVASDVVTATSLAVSISNGVRTASGTGSVSFTAGEEITVKISTTGVINSAAQNATLTIFFATV